MPKHSLSLLLSMLLACSFALAKNSNTVQLHGFITGVTSPYDFEVEGRRVRCTDATLTFIGNSEAWVKTPFRANEIRFGREVDVAGNFDATTQSISAMSVMFTAEAEAQQEQPVKSTVLIELPIQLQRDATGASGTILADGRQIRFTPRTAINFALNETEKDAANAKPAPAGVRVSQYILLPPPPMHALEDVVPGTWLQYEGTLRSNGTVDASKLLFRRNDRDRSKTAFWRQQEASVVEPDYSAGKDGEVRSSRYKCKIVGIPELQKYVQKLGRQFVPEYQNSMADRAADKLHFRFYVVRDERVRTELFPDGLVLVSTALIAKLQNEAQLAAMLAYSVAEVTQEHDFRRSSHNAALTNSLALASVAAPVPGVGTALWATRYSIIQRYQQTLEAQADRISLEALLAHGYDVRQVPEVWRIFAEAWTDSTAKKLWYDSSVLRAHRPYVMSELATRYSSLNYANLKVDSPEFQKATSAIRIEAPHR